MKPNSRQKTTPPPQNRLNKTQQPPPPKNDYLENTNYAQKKPNMYEKPQSQKAMLPPRNGSAQKIDYKIAENMTTSKIKQAKNGLQLLKKKMVRNGMSRQKNQRNTSVEKGMDDPYGQKKVSAKQEQYYGYEKQVKKPTPQMGQKKPSYVQDVPKKAPPSSKTVNDRPIKKQPPPMPEREEYSNPNEEVPLNSNQDFMAILERQMAKQNSKNPPPSNNQRVKQKPMQAQEEEQLVMVQCSRGCGRQFSTQAIAKHEKICQKVFQSKRKAFNSAAHRQADVQDFKMPPPPPPVKQEKVKNTKAKEEKIPKWKQQSAAFRAGLKQGKGQQLTAEQKAAVNQANGSVQCPVCSRTFNEQAGKRHIAFCESKAKQMPKMNTSKRR